MDRYRLLEKKEEIAAMAKKAPVLEIGQIWQTLPVKREVYKIRSMEVLSDAMLFITTMPFEFDSTFPIYINLNFRNLIFKLNPGEYRLFNNQLSCIYPREAKALELRNFERTQLPNKTNLNLVLRTISASTALDIKVSIENFSEMGLGLKASSLNRDYFERNTTFKVIKVCGRNQVEECVLTVRHISDKDNKAFISIGMQSNMALSNRFFQILREEIKRERYIIS
jgi:hypothetical protein